jgi:prevent-host-death family protein
MRKFTSAHAKNHFGELIDAARAAPVAITKYDRTAVVIVATEEYERIRLTREVLTRDGQGNLLKNFRFPTTPLIVRTSVRAVRLD